MTNHEVGIEDFKSRKGFADVAGLELFLTRHGDGRLFRIGVFNQLFEVDFLEVKDDVGDVFLNTGNGIELVANAVDSDARDGEAFERGEEDAAECVADRNAITRFQWLELKLTEGVVGFQHQDFIGFLEI